ANGVLLKIAVAEGEVPVGATIAFIGEQGESVPDVSGNGKVSAPAKEEEQQVEAAKAEEPGAEPAREHVAAEPRKDGERIKASPLARRIARERGVDLASVAGTGPEGRIIAEDVERAGPAPAARPAAPVPTGEAEKVPLTNIRKTIARRLTEAW